MSFISDNDYSKDSHGRYVNYTNGGYDGIVLDPDITPNSYYQIETNMEGMRNKKNELTRDNTIDYNNYNNTYGSRKSMNSKESGDFRKSMNSRESGDFRKSMNSKESMTNFAWEVDPNNGQKSYGPTDRQKNALNNVNIYDRPARYASDTPFYNANLYPIRDKNTMMQPVLPLPWVNSFLREGMSSKTKDSSININMVMIMSFLNLILLLILIVCVVIVLIRQNNNNMINYKRDK